jgi:hypothetical protein
MRFVHEMRYAATLDEVATMLADPAFREEVCAHQQVLDSAVSVTRDGGTLTVVVEQVQEARAIPSYAQKFIGDRIAITQRETWRDAGSADLDITVPGKPARMTGTLTLEADGDETVETLAGELKVSVPLIGGRIEELMGDVVRLALDAEYAVGQRWLAEG